MTERKRNVVLSLSHTHSHTSTREREANQHFFPHNQSLHWHLRAVLGQASPERCEQASNGNNAPRLAQQRSDSSIRISRANRDARMNNRTSRNAALCPLVLTLTPASRPSDDN